jgi:hypothetical protein
MNPLKNTLPLLGQLVKHIPGKLLDTLARKHKIQSRNFSPTSHVVTMMYAQLSHVLSLNDVCDALQNHQSYLLRFAAWENAWNIRFQDFSHSFAASSGTTSILLIYWRDATPRESE